MLAVADQVLGQFADVMRLDPFEYLLVSIAGVMIWTWCSVIGDFALTGRGIWLRWSGLAMAGLGAVMFAYTARLLQ